MSIIAIIIAIIILFCIASGVKSGLRKQLKVCFVTIFSILLIGICTLNIFDKVIENTNTYEFVGNKMLSKLEKEDNDYSLLMLGDFETVEDFEKYVYDQKVFKSIVYKNINYDKYSKENTISEILVSTGALTTTKAILYISALLIGLIILIICYSVIKEENSFGNKILGILSGLLIGVTLSVVVLACIKYFSKIDIIDKFVQSEIYGDKKFSEMLRVVYENINV